MEENPQITDMADFVRKEQERRTAPDLAGIEGADWRPPTAVETIPVPGVPANGGAEAQQPIVPTGPVEPKILGVDLTAGLVHTTIGNFEIPLAERNRITRSCLRVTKTAMAATYTTMAKAAIIRRRGRPPVGKPKGKQKKTPRKAPKE